MKNIAFGKKYQKTKYDILLKTDEITIRLLKTYDEGRIADIEILAHAFKERFGKQDNIYAVQLELT